MMQQQQATPSALNQKYWSWRHIVAGPLVVSAFGLSLVLSTIPGRAAACTEADFSTTVDSAGVNMRRFNLAASPKLQARMKQLRILKGWSSTDDDQLARDYLHDNRIASLDSKANQLLATIDSLSELPEGQQPDCAKLSQLKTATIELQAVMKAKSAYLMDKIDTELRPASTSKKTAAVDIEKPSSAAKKPSKKTPPSGPQVQKSPPAPAPNNKEKDAWQANTTRQPQASTAGKDTERDDYVSLQQDGATIPDQVAGNPPQFEGFQPDRTQGYSMDEIRQASRGFFGKISSGLGSVIEYSFQNWGRPTAYILGKEGGGAFLAGLRYGSGDIYPRSRKAEKIFWHGPSLGYDFGAEGSRTMFLVYRLDDTNGMYRRFAGIDGSAYLVGGVGLTVLKGGKIIMAPIRSGLGLRLGANIGYLRFTPRPTWNPF